MRIMATDLPDVFIIEMRAFSDPRGFIKELWNAPRYLNFGLGVPSVQTNFSRSGKGVLRGLHYQEPHAQGKLVSALAGEVFDVAVDIRKGSPSFGKWTGTLLTGDNHRQLWIPPGFAHGFAVLSDSADFLYQCTAPYDPTCEHAIRWDDPAIGIDWGVKDPLIADKDRAAPLLKDAAVLPPYYPLPPLITSP
jgi:dTDP-4-dehydrorhamnose 3,5-epimerase